MRILNVRQVYFLNIFAIFLLLTVMQIVSQQFNKQFTLKRPGLKNFENKLPALGPVTCFLLLATTAACSLAAAYRR